MESDIRQACGKKAMGLVLVFAVACAALFLGGCVSSADADDLVKPEYYTQEDWDMVQRLRNREVDFWSETYEEKAARQQRLNEGLGSEPPQHVYINSLGYLTDPEGKQIILDYLQTMREKLEGNTDPKLYGFTIDRWTVEEALKAVEEFGAIPDEDLNMFQQGWLYSAEGWLRMAGMEGATPVNYAGMPAYTAALVSGKTATPFPEDFSLGTPESIALAKAEGVIQHGIFKYNEKWVKYSRMMSNPEYFWSLSFEERINTVYEYERLNFELEAMGYEDESTASSLAIKRAMHDELMTMTPAECKQYLADDIARTMNGYETNVEDGKLNYAENTEFTFVFNVLYWPPLFHLGPPEDLLDRIPWEVAIGYVDDLGDLPDEELTVLQKMQLINAQGWLDLLGIEY